jgi:hypothetical protein
MTVIKYMNGNMIQVNRNPDGIFKCGCGKSFQLPQSLQRHAKECNGISLASDEESMNDDVSSEDDDSTVSEIEVDRVEEIPADCFGTMLERVVDSR